MKSQSAALKSPDIGEEDGQTMLEPNYQDVEAPEQDDDNDSKFLN